MMFLDYSVLLIISYWTKLFLIWGKLQRAHPTKSGNFARSYLRGSTKLRKSLEFLYGKSTLFGVHFFRAGLNRLNPPMKNNMDCRATHCLTKFCKSGSINKKDKNECSEKLEENYLKNIDVWIIIYKKK